MDAEQPHQSVEEPGVPIEDQSEGDGGGHDGHDRRQEEQRPQRTTCPDPLVDEDCQGQAAGHAERDDDRGIPEGPQKVRPPVGVQEELDVVAETDETPERGRTVVVGQTDPERVDDRGEGQDDEPDDPRGNEDVEGAPLTALPTTRTLRHLAGAGSPRASAPRSWPADGVGPPPELVSPLANASLTLASMVLTASAGVLDLLDRP